MLKFAKGLLALAPETDLALEHTAAVIGLAADTTYTKQSLSERLSGGLKGFLAGVVTALFSQIARGVPTCQALERFAHVWVHDSTSQTLPKHLAELFPGAGNQHGQDYATLKIQWICDIKNGVVGHVSLSGYTRNDQAAAPDILEVARPGDLVLRDSGYFTTAVLAQFVSAGISFLSRYRHGVNPYDPKTGQPLNLKALLKNSGSLDMDVLLGPERAAVRLVALPVPEEVANQRRHKAKVSAQKRHRSPPGAEHLFLMGWNIFVTNVPAATWPPKVLAAIYRLRWRIEISFKTWKSHLGLPHLNCRTPVLLELSVLTKLLFCALVCQLSDLLELNCPHGQHVSLLRLGHILRTVRLLVLGHGAGRLGRSMGGVLPRPPCLLRKAKRSQKLLRTAVRSRRRLSLTRMGIAATPGLRPEGACTPERGARRLHKGSRPPSGIPIGCRPTPPLNRGSRDASTPDYHLSSLRDELLGGGHSPRPRGSHGGTDKMRPDEGDLG